MECKKTLFACMLALAALFSVAACSNGQQQAESEKADIEETLNLANNQEQEWTYSADGDAWVLSVVSAVAYPELPDQQGVSVCVPGAYVAGIDTDGDGKADVTSDDSVSSGSSDSAAQAQKGSLVINDQGKITSTNGQVYTASTAPVILNTGAAGYSSQENSAASAEHAADGYINVSCGNRGKQDVVTDAEGNSQYTGDAPSCLVDQKAAARYVKYNILLGNLPGDVDRFVSTGGSGGGAHAAMFAATSNHSDFYDYQIEAGAVGIYRAGDDSYSTTVTIDGEDVEISDGAWGCIAYSPITSLYEADMALAFEYFLDKDYSFGTSFQAQLAKYLSQAYKEYINEQDLSVAEDAVGFDLDGDGALDSTVSLTIEYDLKAHPDTNGYYGTYLDLYLAEFTENLQWYVDNLDYADDWTWFDTDGKSLSDAAVAKMTAKDKAQAFLEGRYAKGSSGERGAMRGGGNRMDGEPPANAGKRPGDGLADGEKKGGFGGTLPEGDLAAGPGAENGEKPDGVMEPGGGASDDAAGNAIAGTPDKGTTQSATGKTDSANYSTYEEMVAAYKADIEGIEAGDQYGNNIVSLYNPLQYIGTEDTENPTWVKLLSGAAEGDISMFNSLNLQIAWLNSGADAQIEWQWDGGHVPSEVLGDSFSLYVDQMYGEHVAGAASIEKAAAQAQRANGDASEASGSDIHKWVNLKGTTVSFDLADAAAYRTAGASKAVPGFDVLDYGQEDYVFGSADQDARHWNKYLLEIFEKHADKLESLFNSED